MDKLNRMARPGWLPEPLPVLAPRALDMAGSFLLAWNPGAAAPSPFAAGYVCSLPREQSVYGAFGAFLGYLLTGSRTGAGYGCALALCMALQLLTGWEQQMPLLGAVTCLAFGLVPGELPLWRLALTAGLSGLLGRFLQISRIGSYGRGGYSLTGKLCLLCLVLVVLRPLSVVGALLTLGAGFWLFREQRERTPRTAQKKPVKQKTPPPARRVPPPEPAEKPDRAPAWEAVDLLRQTVAEPEPKPTDPAAEAFLKTAEAVCRDCARQQSCWGDRYKTTRETLRALTPVLQRTHRLTQADLPHGFVTDCPRSGDFCREAEQRYAAALRRRARDGEERRRRQLMEGQLAGMQQLLHRALGEESLPRFLPHLERKARTVAAAYGRPHTVRVYRRGRRLTLELALEGELPTDLAALSGSLELALGCRFHPPRSVGEGPMLRFLQREGLALTLVSSQQPRAGETVCGDSLLHFRTADGRALVLLSDGMGSGEQAKHLSRSALELLAAFVRAGCSLEESCAAVLPALAVRGEQQGYATLDLLEVDLFSGEAVLLKYGAARSWLLRENRAEALGCGTLPAGLDPGEGPEKQVFTLHPGERLLMQSDGVADPEPVLGLWPRESGTELARQLMERSDDRDDRSILLLTASAPAGT